MPDAAIPLRARFEIAQRLLHEHILKLPSARELVPAELGKYKHRNVVHGWQLTIRFPDQDRRQNILVSSTFPFSAPILCLVDRPPFLTWPHVEEDGALCLMRNFSDIDHEDPVAVFQSLLSDTVKLIEDCLEGRNLDDFLHEFHSYWNRVEPGSSLSIPFLSLLKPAPPSRLVSIWRGKEWLVLGDDSASVSKWLVSRFGENRAFYELEKAAFLWLQKPLMPSQYPHNGGSVLAIAAACGTQDLLYELVAETPSSVSVVLGANTENGPCLGGITTLRPRDKDVLGRAHNVLGRGFRPGRVPKELKLSRYLDTRACTTRSQVERVDTSWIHGRDKDPYHHTLRSKAVAILGCGSLGAAVAVQLAMTGVGKLILIDPETLTWANVGRHPLGAKFVGTPKASNLAKELATSYPHGVFEPFDSRWEP